MGHLHLTCPNYGNTDIFFINFFPIKSNNCINEVIQYPIYATKEIPYPIMCLPDIW